MKPEGMEKERETERATTDNPHASVITAYNFFLCKFDTFESSTKIRKLLFFASAQAFPSELPQKQANLIYEGFLYLALSLLPSPLIHCGFYLSELKIQSQNHDDVVSEKWFLMLCCCLKVRQTFFLSSPSSAITTFVAYENNQHQRSFNCFAKSIMIIRFSRLLSNANFNLIDLNV